MMFIYLLKFNFVLVSNNVYLVKWGGLYGLRMWLF